MLIALTGLSACAASRLGRAPSGAAATRVSTVNVGGKSVTIEGPRGFCVDSKFSQTGGDTAFVLLGNCRVVSPRSRGASPKVKALLTASVSGNGAKSGGVANISENLDRFFRSDTGRTALSRSSDPGTVQVLDTFQKDGAFYLRARDTSKGIVPGASQDYWRSYFSLDGQIFSVSVIGFRSDPLPPEKGLAIAREFTGLIRQRNGGRVTPVATPVIAPVVAEVVATSEPVTRPQPAAARPRKKRRASFWSLGLLRKLVN